MRAEAVLCVHRTRGIFTYFFAGQGDGSGVFLNALRAVLYDLKPHANHSSSAHMSRLE